LFNKLNHKGGKSLMCFDNLKEFELQNDILNKTMYEGVALWILKCDNSTNSNCETNSTKIENVLSSLMFKVFHSNEVVDYDIYGQKPVRNQWAVSNYF
jgi:hypothetical protein